MLIDSNSSLYILQAWFLVFFAICSVEGLLMYTGTSDRYECGAILLTLLQWCPHSSKNV